MGGKADRANKFWLEKNGEMSGSMNRSNNFWPTRSQHGEDRVPMISKDGRIETVIGFPQGEARCGSRKS